MTRYLRDLTADELAQLQHDAQQPASVRYAARRLDDAPAYAHEALSDIEDRLLDYTGPEAASLLDEVEARIDRHGVRR